MQGYWSRFGPGAADWDLIGGLLAAAVWGAKLRKARRIEHFDYAHPLTRFAAHRLPDGIVEPLLRHARAHHATLNDLFLATMARVCDRHVAAPVTNKRNALALGTIVDLREALRPDPKRDRDELGIFLGFTSVLCRKRDFADDATLLRAVAAQNARLKRQHAAESSMVRMCGGLLAGSAFSDRRLLNWYRKRLPLCAGISNVNLNRTWAASFHPDPIIEYLRVSPVGPIMPIVFTPSTLGQTLHFGLTYREAVIPEAQAEVVARDFSERLIAIACGRANA
jgi:hypothetical protein